MLNNYDYYYEGTPVSCLRAAVFDSELSPRREMHLERMFQYMQEAAAQNLRFITQGGEDPVRAQGCAWIMNSVSLRLHRLPRAEEQVSYFTYPGPRNALFLHREYSFRAGTEWLGGASSSWIIADAATHRPVRVTDALCSAFGQTLDETAMGLRAQRFRGHAYLRDCELSCVKRAAYSDLDVNGHMSNTRYAAWCMDGVQALCGGEATVLGMDINYLGELYEGDEVTLGVTRAARVDEAERLRWLGDAKLGAQRAADAYVHAVKADGSLCFKAQLFFSSGLEGAREVAFLTAAEEAAAAGRAK